MTKILKAIIRVYTYLLSPLLGQSCRFHPTCSGYALEALDQYGAVKGTALTVKRVCRCHPWNKSGFLDPVPDSIAWAQIIGYKRADLNDSTNKKEISDAKP